MNELVREIGYALHSRIAVETRRALAPNQTPGPRKLNPLLGCLPEVSTGLLEYIDTVAHQFPEIAFYHAGAAICQVTDPGLVRQVLAVQHEKTQAIVFPRTAMRSTLGEGVLFSQGTKWRNSREAMQPQFHHGKLENFADIVHSVLDETVDQLKSYQETGATFDLNNAMSEMTLKIVLRSLFCQDLPLQDYRSIIDFTIRYNELFVDTLTKSPLSLVNLLLDNKWDKNVRKLHDIVEQADIIFDRLIDHHLEYPPGTFDDLLSLFMNIQFEGQPNTREQVKNEIRTFILAGHDTSARGLTWLWYNLSQKPECIAKLTGELQATGKNARELGPHDLRELPYHRATIEESLRLHPPSWVNLRMAKENLALKSSSGKDYFVPRGTYIIVSPYGTHRSPAYWENAEQFNPERFLLPNRKTIHPGAFFPFGGGPRHCIGQGFAMTEMQLAVARLNSEFAIQIITGEVEPMASLVLRAKNPIMAKVTQKE